MKNSEFLFENMGQIPDRFVLEADAALGLSGKSAHRSSHKVWRTVLIAAAIMAFMGVTAYAAGFLGLKERVAPIGEAEVEVRGELQNVPVAVGALNGVTDSPEYQAAQEWFAFVNTYEAQKEAEAGDAYSWCDYEQSFAKSELEKAIADVYFVYDRTEMDKLLEIAEKYDLRLLTEEKSPIWSEEELYGLTGLKAFILQDENDFSYAYCFEDGSFNMEGFLNVNGQEVLYEVSRIMSGCLYPFPYYWAVDTEYEEWEYVTAGGQTVGIAAMEDGVGHDYTVLVFYDLEGAFVTEVGRIGDGSMAGGYDYRAIAQGIADSFDLDALTAARGVDAAAWNAWVEKPQPTPEHVPLTLFCPNGEEGSPEYLAMMEWSRFLDTYEASVWDDDFAENETEHAIAEIYGAYDRTTLDKLLEIADKYQLRLYTGSTTVFTEEELCTLAGIEPYRKPSQNWEYDDYWYAWCCEDGSFRAFGPDLRLDGQDVICTVSRFRAGSLIHCNWFRPVEGACEEWTYITADGQPVDIVVWEGVAWDYDFYILYSRNGSFVILEGSIGDGSQTGDYDYRAMAESIAELYDLEALTA